MSLELNRSSLRAKMLARDLITDPLTWEQIAHAHTPIELEVGSGKGMFLLAAAAERPQHTFLGVELLAKFANRAADRLARRQLTNVHMLRGDAQKFLAQVVPDQSVIAVHVYFPDPWWRNKHKRRRVLNEQVVQDIERSLAAGGKLHFWTDALDYYEHICGLIMDTTRLAGPSYVPQRAAEHSMDYTTHFERLARTQGQPVYRAIFTKL